jgi:hypothetical protein
MFAVMPCLQWQRLIFALVFICVVSGSCFAGPLKMPLFCTQEEQPLPFPTPLPFLTNLFPRSAAFLQLQLPTTMLRLDEINLTHITTPPEFRVHDPKTANVTEVPWPPPQPWPPCPVWHGGSL